ncbi:MAG: DNA cytosine methyltransferase [bacterium]
MACKNKKYKIVSLFAGCGGLDLGFKGGFSFLNKKYPSLNYDVVWANDLDENACQTFSRNLGDPIVAGDIIKILSSNNGHRPLPEKTDIVLGGFPCQDFSHAGKRRGFNSKRGVLYKSMAEVIKKTNPVLFVAENVRGLMTMDNGKAVKTIIKHFSELGYHIEPQLYLAADYEVPQKRERIIMVGTKKGVLPAFEHPKPKLKRHEWISLKKAIGDLEYIPEGRLPNHYWSRAIKNKGQGNSLVSSDKPGPTMRAEHHGNIEWHWNGKRRLSAREAARIQSFPDDFVFHPSTSSAYKQIGNAVPPVMAWHLASHIQSFLNKHLNPDAKS